MPKIVEEIAYNGFAAKVARLGLAPLVDEVRRALTGFTLNLAEKKNANGAAAVRVMLDGSFESLGGWKKTVSGDVDWIKMVVQGSITTGIGVEVQISGRSDMLAVDVIHLRRKIKDGAIDAGVIVVPSEATGVFLVDRTPTIADAKRHITEADFDDSPILLIAFEHDGPGPALKKMSTNTGAGKSGSRKKPTAPRERDQGA